MNPNPRIEGEPVSALQRGVVDDGIERKAVLQLGRTGDGAAQGEPVGPIVTIVARTSELKPAPWRSIDLGRERREVWSGSHLDGPTIQRCDPASRSRERLEATGTARASDQIVVADRRRAPEGVCRGTKPAYELCVFRAV